VIGQDKALATIARLKKRGLAGRAYWITGKSGQGKTTIARLLADEVATELGIEELDSARMTPAKLQDAERSLHLCGFGDKGGRALIINEAHGLNRSCITELLVFLERLPSHAVVIFTTTKQGEKDLFSDYHDAHPLLSRCITLALSTQGLAKPFAERAREIAIAEGLDGQPESEYIKLANKCQSNMRAMLQAVEAGEMLV
jgi:replication-associated recombination protein RarA